MDISWLIGHTLDEVSLDSGTSSWHFYFNDSTTIRTDSPWRLIRDGRIVIGSEDHGQPFGLPEPVDAEAKCRSDIGGAIVGSAEIRADTRDIVIIFEPGVRLEIITVSSGYESWQVLLPDGTMVIAQGGGNLVGWDPSG
jgi:hypothetical protein